MGRYLQKNVACWFQLCMFLKWFWLHWIVLRFAFAPNRWAWGRLTSVKPPITWSCVAHLYSVHLTNFCTLLKAKSKMHTQAWNTQTLHEQDLYTSIVEGAFPCVSCQEQWGVWCFAQMHLSSAQNVNWPLSSHQFTLNIDWSEWVLTLQPSCPQAKSLHPEHLQESSSVVKIQILLYSNCIRLTGDVTDGQLADSKKVPKRIILLFRNSPPA